MKNLLLASLSLLLASPVSASDNNPAEEKAVAAAVAAFNQAAKAGDAAKLGELLSEDLVYSHSSGKSETKKECIAGLVKGRPDFRHGPNQIVRVYGRAAYVRTELVAHNVVDGQTTETPLIMLQVWAKDGGQWRMVARHTTRLTPPKS
jgi:ketosteroid isomerase-like protein